MSMQELASVASIASSVATVALVILTLFYVKAAKDMLGETREARLQEYRPEVVVDFETDPGLPNCLYVALKNIGRGLARDISFLFDPPPVNSSGDNLADMGCYRDGLSVLSPGRKIDCFYETLIELLKDSTSAVKEFTVTVRYSDSSGSKEYEESFHLDAGQFAGRHYVMVESVEKCLQKIARACEDIERKLREMAEAYAHANYRQVSEGMRAEMRGFDYFTGQFPADDKRTQPSDQKEEGRPFRQDERLDASQT